MARDRPVFVDHDLAGAPAVLAQDLPKLGNWHHLGQPPNGRRATVSTRAAGFAFESSEQRTNVNNADNLLGARTRDRKARIRFLGDARQGIADRIAGGNGCHAGGARGEDFTDHAGALSPSAPASMLRSSASIRPPAALSR